MDEQEYGIVEQGQGYEEYEDAPSAGIEVVLMIFTTIFLLLGIAFMGYELHSVYGFMQSDTETAE